jgi:hypothetical protein
VKIRYGPAAVSPATLSVVIDREGPPRPLYATVSFKRGGKAAAGAGKSEDLPFGSESLGRRQILELCAWGFFYFQIPPAVRKF